MKEVMKGLDRLFSFFVFVVILLLAGYMATRIWHGLETFVLSLFDGEFAADEAGRRALHGIAETIVLVKAYRLLVSYLRTHHVSVEYIVEISIIASAIELLFAYDLHSLETKIVFGVYGLANLFFYLQYFGPEHDETLHRQVKSHK